jgi:preprotein translocase subunit YajC
VEAASVTERTLVERNLINRFIQALGLVAATLGAAIGCDPVLGPPRPGDLQVTLTTSGADLDPDGYAVVLDTTPPHAIAVNDTWRVSAVTPGSHIVTLAGLAANCAVAGDNPRIVTVPESDTAVVTFVVHCSTTHGVLQISAATTGGVKDPDGYSACVDASSDKVCAYGGPVVLPVSGVSTVTVDTGTHVVLLSGLAPNCTVAGDNPRAVSVSTGQTVDVPFAIACKAAILHVTTTTTGVQLDPDGYTLCLDPYNDGCDTYTLIGANSVATLDVAYGSHVVELDGVAGNCPVSGDNPRTVGASDTMAVSFVITCLATGSVRVAISTTGTDIDPDYFVCVGGAASTCNWSTGASSNGLVTVAGVTAGAHTVTLTGVSPNCSVSGTPARVVAVPENGVVDVSFNVRCVLAERIAFSTGDGTISVLRVDHVYQQSIGKGFAPAWSSDGTRLAYECGQDICAINADSTAFARLTVDGASNRHPTWSPDGSKIAFAATHGSATDLYVMAANGSGAVRVTQGVGFLGSPAWSPDGTTIAFDCRVDAGNDDICSVNIDGTAFARLTNDPARDYGAAWKPDGSTLAFATTRDGLDEIVLMSPAGGSVTRIGTGLPGFAPTWSPDGAQLALVQVYDGYDATYDIVVLAHADGSNVRYLTAGDQPAWKPHP